MWWLQAVKGNERAACNLLALLTTSVPLTLKQATSSGILVALGTFRGSGCPRAAAEAAKALHAQLQRQAKGGGSKAAASGASAARGVPPALLVPPPPSGRVIKRPREEAGAAGGGKGRAVRAAAAGAAAAVAAAVAAEAPAAAAGGSVKGVKMDKNGVIEELDEELLARLPPDEVRLFFFLRPELLYLPSMFAHACYVCAHQ